MMIRHFGLSIALLSTLFGLAQRGTITGTVTAMENGKAEPQPFASVTVRSSGVENKGTSTGASTDLDGKYMFKVEPGNYTVVTTMVGYPSVEKAVSVIEDQSVTVDLELNGGAQEMKAVEVVKEKRVETETAVLMETRKSDQVVNGIGRQQIAKSQDRTAGDVVKRIPGVTIINDRFVMIRGLADRYNTVLLNDAVAPSLEADKRAFSFDLIPSGALDRILIYKSGAPELPGDFAGGVVKVATVGVPEKNETKLNYAASYRSGTTFNDFYKSQGSGTDALGFDNGFRKLPSDFPANLYDVSDVQQLAALGREMPNNWTAQKSTATPDQRAGFFIARRFGKQGGNTYGNVTSIDYTSTSQHYTAHNYNYNTYDLTAQRSDTIYNYTDNEYLHNVRASVLHNWSALIGTKTKLEFRNLFNQLGEDRTTMRTGRDLEGNSDVRNYAFRYQQRTIYSGQLHGSHELGNSDMSTLNWTLGYGKGINKEPDFRRVRTQRDLDQADANGPYHLVLASGASTLDAGRFFSDLNETVMSGKLDFEQKIRVKKEGLGVKVLAGGYTERKDRDFSARWMSFKMANLVGFDNSQLSLPLDQVFSTDHINSTTGFKLEEGTNPSDKYTGANTLLAGYVSGQVSMEKKWNVSGGVRVENNRQELTSATYGGQKIGVDKQLIFVLPSVNATWNFGEKSLVRAGYSATVNRPEFRELAPFSFYDFSTNNFIYGNPNLRTATIQNADVRYEIYPTLNEVLSLGAFVKNFTDPIEMFYVPGTGGGGTRNFTFGNAKGAQSFGAEAEVRRSLNGWFTEGWLSHLGVLFNATYIHSEVDLGTTQGGQSATRPMMGQSPYVLNAGLYFSQPEKKLQYNILYNICGQRLFAIGSVGIPDIYEMPRNVIDATVSKGIGKHLEVKLSAQDILDQPVRLVQDSNANGSLESTDEEVMSYRRGAYFSAGASWKF